MLLSSAWGLPVRGRREKDGQLQTLKISSQIELPPAWWPIDVESGSALYRPRALKIQELVLSALGGTLRHDSDFVPPSAARHIAYGPLFDSLSVERWQHWTVLGRDVFAEVVYKGYLFPIGHRASLVKQTERIFLRPPSGGPMRAYLRQRTFIRIAQPDKVFPAVGQPNGGRQFPAGMVRMLTLTTPDLVNPSDDTGKNIPKGPDGARQKPEPGGRLFGNEAGLVFWPRTARLADANVRFEFEVQGAATSAPLIFVDNVAINRPDLMARLVTHYNSQISSPDDFNQQGRLHNIRSEHLRTLDMRGRVLRYCDELKPGSASHKTQGWTLKATGARGGSQEIQTEDPFNWEGKASLFDDPSLESADQPPFYPAIQTARIRVDQVERMTGGAPQLVLTQFDGWYLKNGFSKVAATQEKDALEVYLDIVSVVELSMGSNGDRSGGVMRPEGRLIALSRQRGPLSGSLRIAPRIVGTVTASAYPVMPTTEPEDAKVVSLSSVRSTFAAAPGIKAGVPAASRDAKPQSTQSIAALKEYFGSDKLLETRILGVVKISDLLKYMNLGEAAASLPRLQEAVDYGMRGVGATAEGLRKQVIAPLYGIVQELDRHWQDAGRKVQETLPGFLGGMGDVFPDVDQALHDLHGALKSANSTSDDATLFASMAEIYECGRRLMDACERVIANPLDRVQIAVQQKLGELSQSVVSLNQTLKDLAPGTLVNLASQGFAVVQGTGRPFGYPFDWMSQIQADFKKLQDRAEEKVLKEAFELAWKSLIDKDKQPHFVARLASSINAAQVEPPYDAGQEARRLIAATLADAAAWLKTVIQPLADAKPTNQDDLRIVNAGKAMLNVAIQRADAARVEVLSGHIDGDSDYESSVSAVAKALGVVHALGSAKTFALIARSLADYVELVLGEMVQSVPSEKNLSELLDKVIEPITPKVLLRALKRSIADPDEPRGVAPEDPDTLVGRLHRLAAGIEEAVAWVPTADETASLRKWLVKLKDDSRSAKVAVHDAVVELKLASETVIQPELRVDHVGASPQTIETATRRMNRLADTLGSSLKLISDDLRQISALDWSGSRISEKVLQELKKTKKPQALKETSWRVAALQTEALKLVGLARQVLVTALKWLQGSNDELLAQLGVLHTASPSIGAAWKILADKHKLEIERAIKIDTNAQTDPDKQVSDNLRWLKTSPIDWLPQLDSPVDTLALEGPRAEIALHQLLVKQVMAWQQKTLRLQSQAFDTLIPKLATTLSPILESYESLAKARAKAFEAANGIVAELAAVVLLVKVDPTTLYDPDEKFKEAGAIASTHPGNDQLAADIESLKNLLRFKKSKGVDDSRAASNFLWRFMFGWSTGSATPLRIVQQVQRISLEEIRARLLNLIDFAAIREEIEEQIKLLIPTSTSVSYDFATSIGAGASAATDGIFKPKEGCALRVHSQARVNLLDPGAAPVFESVGELGAFDITLVGNLMDAVTLKFNGVRFISHGGPVDCDLRYAGFKIGEALKFIEKLSPFFGAKPGTGFYLRAMDTGIGIEAGYRLSLGTISIGNLAFFNVSLNAAARLPFDKQPATFVASLSRRDAPFTIAIAPYGGSGFFALEADTEGIVGFEASFEYGGAGAFAYGPLEGTGRLMTGIYIRSTRKSTEISATFYVGGSASIWIFNFGASLYVDAHQDGKSNKMVGDATYSFSFSMGIVDFDYHVTVHVALDWGGGGGGSKSSGSDHAVIEADEPIWLAALDGDLADPLQVSDAGGSRGVYLPSPVRKPVAPLAASTRPKRRVDTRCQGMDWGGFVGYFDLDLDVAVEEF